MSAERLSPFTLFDGVGLHKARLAAKQAHGFALGDTFFEAGAVVAHHAILTRHHGGHVNAHGAGADAPALRLPGVIGDLRAGHHGFGGRASGVDAGAAEIGLFHQGNVPALIGQPEGEGVARLSRADDDRVEIHAIS